MKSTTHCPKSTDRAKTPAPVRIQPNRTFCCRQEIDYHISEHLPGFVVVRVWHNEDGALCCLVEGPAPKGRKK